jgi:hypothetical protein
MPVFCRSHVNLTFFVSFTNDRYDICLYNAARLKQAGEELRRCGISKGKDIVKQSQALSWFVGGNRQKILQLQKGLNKLGIKGKNGRLKEDGIYGKETLSAWMAFMKSLKLVPFPRWLGWMR